jgi:DNA primase large subunit
MVMLSISTILKYYKREDVQSAIVENARGREVAIKFGDKGFGKRPEVLNYPRDVIELAKRGASSFHISEEHWKNPLQLNPMLRKQELDELRNGWDLVLDIDCHLLEYSRVAAELVMEVLRQHNLKSVSCKFSGNKGFHLGVPNKALPTRISNVDTNLLFPDAARRIAQYIKYTIKAQLSERVLEMEKGSFSAIMKKTGKSASDITMYEKNKWGDKTAVLNTEAFLKIDTVLISSRHLYRSAYSLHEKSGLASVPVEQIASFSVDEAIPEKVEVGKIFLDDTGAERGEAKRLFTEAFDYQPVIETPKEFLNEKHAEIPQDKIPEAYFPPCMKNILVGLSDGRKRAILILLNFLNRAGWSYDDIQVLLTEWNKKNNPPLREVSLIGPLRYHKQHKKKMPPPNCSATMYYKDIGVCKPDNLCSRIKNPINYSLRKVRYKADK